MLNKQSVAYRGELRCFACARYLGEFESHPTSDGPPEIRLITPDGIELRDHPVETDKGLRCSRCGGKVVADWIDRVALAA